MPLILFMDVGVRGPEKGSEDLRSNMALALFDLGQVPNPLGSVPLPGNRNDYPQSAELTELL